MSYIDAYANSRIDEDLALVAEVGLSVDEAEVSAEGYTRQASPSWSSASGRQAVNTTPVVFTITVVIRRGAAEVGADHHHQPIVDAQSSGFCPQVLNAVL